MALKDGFYSEIFKKEKYWTELCEINLLNVYYLDELKKFYLAKKVELENETDKNDIVISFLGIINSIILKIDQVTEEYRKGKKIDITSVVKLFLINQMNNNKICKDNSNIIRLQVQKQLLENMKNDYNLYNDYLYDDHDYDVKLK